MVKTGDLHYVYVLIYLDCYHKIWQTWELINERNLFLTVLGAGSQRRLLQQTWCLETVHILVHRGLCSHYVPTW